MSDKKRIVQLDFFRSIAVVLVILFHLNIYSSIIPYYNTFILNGGEIGVSMFFILSGYLMTTFYTQKVKSTENTGFALKQVNAAAFYSSRFFRIIPLFFVTTLIFFVFRNHIMVYKQSGMSFSLADFITGIFFLNNKLFVLNPVIWTLKVEIIFYLIFPAIGKFIQKVLLVKTELLLLFLIVIICTLPIFHYYHCDNLFFNNLSGLTMGILIRIMVLIFEAKYPNFKLKSLFATCIVLLSILMLYWVLIAQHNFYFQSLMCLVMGIVFFSLLLLDKESFLLKILGLDLFYRIALLSYSFYLWHFNIYYNVVKPFLQNFHLKGGKIYGVLCPLLSISITILISIMSYFLIEKPSLKLKKLVYKH
jgi:peptidoglycan/LPS O-acetylase OafA/YrhL